MIKIKNLLAMTKAEVSFVVKYICKIILCFVQYAKFKKQTSSRVVFLPIVSDVDLNAAKLGEYFWQDQFVAKEILKINPIRHIDVGSRIDGFVSILSCYRNVEVFDIRPLPYSISNVIFHQADISNLNQKFFNIADCVTSLHALEHIGLGRYGDQIDVEGWKKGLQGLSYLLRQGGLLWLSVPVGKERIYFNAHRIFCPTQIIDYAKCLNLSILKYYYLVDDNFVSTDDVDSGILSCLTIDYTIGIFVFKKNDK